MSANERKVNCREALHVRAVLISDGTSADGGSLFGRKLLEKKELKQPARGWCAFVRVKLKMENGLVTMSPPDRGGGKGRVYSVPAFLASRLGGGANGQGVFEPVIAWLDLGQAAVLLVGTPFLPIFGELFQTLPKTFYRIDLRRVCDDQFGGVGEGNIKIGRLHCK